MKNLKRITTSLIAVVILMSTAVAQQTVIFDTHLNKVVSSNSANLPVDSIVSDTTIISDTTLMVYAGKSTEFFTHNIPTTFNSYIVQFELVYKAGGFNWSIDTNNTSLTNNTSSLLSVRGPLKDTIIISGGSSIKYSIDKLFNGGRYELTSTIMHTVDTIFINSMSSGLFNSTQNKVEFTLFPNPVVNDININFDNTNNDNVSFIIFDMSGRMVKTGNLDNNRNIVDVSNLIQGTYITVLSIGSDKVTKRFVKQ